MKTVFRILGFIQKSWVLLLMAFVSILLTTAFGILIPKMLGSGMDTVLSSGSRTYIWVAAGIIVVAALLRGLSGYGQRYFAEVAAQKITYNMRNAIYERLQRLSFAFHDQNQTGQLMSRATVDVEVVRMFFSQGFLGLTQIVFMVIGVGYLLISMNWQLGLITIGFVIPVAYIAALFGQRMRPIWLKIQALMGFMGDTLEESLSGISVVKAFSHQDEDFKKFDGQAQDLYNQQMKAARMLSFNMPTMIFLISAPTVFILWFGGHQVAAGRMTVGEITSFILLMAMMMMPIRRLGMMVNLFSRTASAGQRILEILDTESVVKEKAGAIKLGKIKGEVSFRDVSFSYNGVSPALKNVSFDVRPGQLVALLGQSGSGKSTIANLLARFYDVDSGQILIDGHDVRDVTLASLRKNVVTAQQDVFLFSATVKENIAYGAVGASMDKIIEVSKAAYLHDFVNALPEKYDTWVGERGDTLSGGEKQRLSIARTLLVNPSILILDDSTASVDSQTEKLIRQALDRLIKGRTTFIITHRIPIIQNADLILMLKDGDLVEKGTHNELIAKDGIYKQVFESQLMLYREQNEAVPD
ncbi:MAG TPA: ABC transporter ATP-binding protein [Dehalococcoidales bacterium]|nr:ABC transporter ATP-binding protein [Dehalococcoidales bacterium]